MEGAKDQVLVRLAHTRGNGKWNRPTSGVVGESDTVSLLVLAA